MSSDAWCYIENSKSIGPLQRDELESAIAQGIVGPDTLVWREGLSGWKQASQYFEFGGANGGPPPVPGTDGLYQGAPSRGFGEAVSVCLSKYFTFSGRASRSEYWYFFLFVMLISIVAIVLDIIIFGVGNKYQPLNTLVNLGLFLPSMAVLWRRLHDTNRSGWWYGGPVLTLIMVSIILGFFGAIGASTGGASKETVLALFGVVGIALLVFAVIWIVFACQKGTLGPNRFG